MRNQTRQLELQIVVESCLDPQIVKNCRAVCFWSIWTGWCFGTWILFLYIYWECHHPNWRAYFSIFFRGVGQPPTSENLTSKLCWICCFLFLCHLVLSLCRFLRGGSGDDLDPKTSVCHASHFCIYSEGTCPRRLLYHLFEAPVLGPWAHLGFEKKRPQSLNKRPTKAWGTNRHGLDVKLLSISRKTSKARVANHNGLDVKLLRSSWKTIKAWVANHNGLDAKLLRSSWKTTKAWVANHNGSDAKLLRMSLKIQEKKKILFLLFVEAFS